MLIFAWRNEDKLNMEDFKGYIFRKVSSFCIALVANANT